jgi:hypothetical protein
MEKLWQLTVNYIEKPALLIKTEVFFRIGRNIFSSLIKKEKMKHVINEMRSLLLELVKNVRLDSFRYRLKATYSLKSILEPDSEYKSNILKNRDFENQILMNSFKRSFSTVRIKHRFEVVVQIIVYQNNKPDSIFGKFLFLGSQTLKELKNCITCSNILSKHFKSSLQNPTYIFFGESIYMDSCGNNLDRQIHRTIKSIFNNKKVLFQSLETTTFEDLVIKFDRETIGLMWHSNDCVHYVSISNLWMTYLTEKLPSKALYPKSLLKSILIKPLCGVCMSEPAKRVTFYDKEALCNQMSFCEDCYRRLHYDEKGKTLYKDFLVFPAEKK